MRKALEALARAGRISIEQGRGTLVTGTPRLTYQIGKRTRLRRNLVPQGVDVTGALVSAVWMTAPDDALLWALSRPCFPRSLPEPGKATIIAA